MTHAMADYAYGRTGGLVIAALTILALLALYGLVWLLSKIAPRVVAVWQSRGTVAETPEEDDLCAVAEAVAEERTEEPDDFLLWDAAMDERPRVHRYVRRMERGSR